MEKERELRTELSWEEIGQKVELYNAATKDHLKMTLVSGAELSQGLPACLVWSSFVLYGNSFTLRLPPLCVFIQMESCLMLQQQLT